MKKEIIALIFLLFGQAAVAQLTLESCYEKARKNYPLLKQHGLIEKSRNFSLENAGQAFKPQFAISARSTWQSQITEFPGSRGSISQDQYQIMAEVRQKVADGGRTGARQALTTAAAAVEQQQIQVELFELNDRVNQLFFGILLLNEELTINSLLDDELATSRAKIGSWVENGVANTTDLDIVAVEQLNNQQRRIEILATRKSYCDMLSLLLGDAVNENTHLQKPVPRLPEVPLNLAKHPQLQLFAGQEQLAEIEKKNITAKNRPQSEIFIQDAFGQPGLNMLREGFSNYVLGGLRFSWDLSGTRTRRNEFRQVENQKNRVEVFRSTFLFNLQIQIARLVNEIARLQELLKSDDEIIRLRASIKLAAEAKVANGTLTSTDLVRELNACDLARQAKAAREIKLLLTIYNLRHLMNEY